MLPAQLSLSLSQHQNRFLFSDHYLDEVLKREPHWKESLAEALDFFDWLKRLYETEKAQLPGYKEAQLETNWFDPILERLGHTFEKQASVPSLKGTGMKFPDYVFFPDAETRKAAISVQNTEEYARKALVIGEMKKWGIPLSKKIKGGTAAFENNNPSYQIDYYLRATDISWGILTNGQQWRLVNKESSYKLDIYFEIDLEKAIENNWQAAIVYFYLFFHQKAFRPDQNGQIFLAQALKSSRAYALQLENDLRDNAYKALEQLITGFFVPSQNKLDPKNPEHLKTVYTNSLYLLYRILFLFYGENRGLLPIENEQYQTYSLTALAKKIATQLDRGEKTPPMTNIHWNHLMTLFRIIGGEDVHLNAYLGVPRYNGGLFNPQLHPFLETHAVGDQHLAQAIDYLSRRAVFENKKFAGRERVDYRTLGVRQLGSIYEGLLEYQPKQATEPMVAIRKGRVEEWIPASERKPIDKILERREPGEMYLATDKGERKATGSYYTPDYIVKYIVENTLNPLIEEAREKVKAQPTHPANARGHAQKFVDEILALKVLDPAMGSGHFIVEATDHLARALATDSWVTEAEAVAEEDLVYWRRKVVERCIYGVDKNRLAVELAKLSLWLVTASADKPLSFLDHHLRHGDSLVGAKLQDLSFLPTGKKTDVPKTQQNLFDESAFTRDTGLAVGGMLTIQNLPSERIEDIHAKEETFKQLQKTHVDKWRAIAHLWVSAFFGNDMAPEEYARLLNHLQGKETLPETVTQRYLTHPAFLQNDYFHWELEFPEIFFDEFGRSKRARAGFDAVIGNPPYVRQEVIKDYKPFFEQHFRDVYAGTADLFVYFFAQALNLLRREGRTSYISSNSWLYANFATTLRAYLRKNTTVEKLIDLGDNQVFEDAPDLYPAIHVVCWKQPFENQQAETAIFTRGEGIQNFAQQLTAKSFFLRIDNQPDEGWRLKGETFRDVIKRVLGSGQELGEYVSQEIKYGIKTGLNEAFIIQQSIRDSLVTNNPHSHSILKPMVSGADIRPWFWENKQEWIIALSHGWTKQTANQEFKTETEAWKWFETSYPAIAEHLKPFEQSARARADQGEYWWELRPCNYWADFEGWKIFYPEMAKYPRFVMAEPGIVGNKTTFMLPFEDYYLLGILMSRTSWFAIQNICQPIGERAGMLRYMLSTQFLEHLPIPTASDENRNQIETLSRELSTIARVRNELAVRTRHRFHIDLGTPNYNLNQKLSEWWQLDFATFRVEIKKVFKRDIPLSERDEWENYFTNRVAEHKRLTGEIIRMETELNAIVYQLFDLLPEEIRVIEESTKYKYGEV